MITKLFPQDTLSQPPNCNEGNLFKRFQIYGREFEIFYGYYEDFERNTDGNEPIPIYPDFIKNPVFTAEGIPFATAMQDICEHYIGKKNGDCCMDCKHFEPCEELFGICKCDKKTQNAKCKTRCEYGKYY